jgi:hypothetical protein
MNNISEQESYCLTLPLNWSSSPVLPRLFLEFSRQQGRQVYGLKIRC